MIAPEEINNFEELLQLIWADLEDGATNSKSQLHTPAFATLSEGSCHLRTVVLRRVLPQSRQLLCHTDIRSPKVDHIQKQPAVSYLFYDAERKIQIRAEGTGAIHFGDEVALDAWRRTSLSSRRAYLTEFAPSTAQDEPISGLPPNLTGRIPTEEESASGQPNFAVIATTIERLDWLYLAASGHRRAQFDWNGQAFAGTWLIP